MPRQGMRYLREQTRKFIGENPVDIVLTRYTKVNDGAGGTRTTNEDLPAQRMRVIAQRSAVAIERRTIGGVTVTPDLVLQGMPETDVVRGDTFTYNGVLMEVVWVHVFGYEKLAEVTIR